MNVGDIVRITIDNATGSIEGVVTRTWTINDNKAFQVSYMNKFLSMNEHDVNVEVLYAVEPEAIGSVFYDEYSNPWVKYSNYLNENWIGESGITSTWDGLQP